MDTVRRTQRQVDLSFIDQQLDPKLMEKFDYPYSLTTARDSQELAGIHQIACH
jgi:spore cortex formation protein SpoVR/YcgB (stage V sporulation)